jgi:hypothetical protein
MTTSSRLLHLAIAVLAGMLLAGGGYAIGAGSAGTATIHGCVVGGTNQLLIQRHCQRGESPLVWNRQGPIGVQGQRGPQGPPSAAAWANVAPGVSGAIVLGGENLSVRQDGNGVFTLTAGGVCASARDAELVTPSTSEAAANGIPAAYVVTPSGPSNVFQVVTGGIGKNGTFTPGNVPFSVAVLCKQG